MAEKRGRLVVIEDHKDLRRALRMILESFGYEVTSSDDAKEGLEQARELKPILVFCDLHVAGLPCLDILKALKNELPETKIIMTGTDTTCEEGLRYGACYCLSNPITLVQLLSALKHCLGHSIS